MRASTFGRLISVRFFTVLEWQLLSCWQATAQEKPGGEGITQTDRGPRFPQVGRGHAIQAPSVSEIA